MQATLKYVCGSQILPAMKLLEIPLRLPTYLVPHSEKYFMSCLRQSLSRREICTFKEGRSLQELSHHQPKIPQCTFKQGWPMKIGKRGTFFYKITLSTYCIARKVDKRRYSNWLLWCYFPKEKTRWPLPLQPINFPIH